ncbi:tRNA pseudouridine synthase 3 [Savitreella phatthalungensis]
MNGVQGKGNPGDSRFDGLSRDDLILRIKQLEKAANRGRSPRPATRDLDFSRYVHRYVAFKFAYLGWHYNGLVVQDGPTEFPTVEEELFKALLHCKLIESPNDCNFSRCGRTDKGVSAMGQVMALRIRTNERIEDQGTKQSDLPPPWLEQLNSALPPSIRIYAYDDTIAPEFSARFSCKSRSYKYVISPQILGLEKLDVGAMNEACAHLLGTHDFRNFCKLDASKQITDFRRRILHASVSPLVLPDDPHAAGQLNMLVFDLTGTAFLWHQVRCITAILLLVGQRLESPTIVRDMLDPDKYPTKPGYDMADDWPLTLYDCDFGDAVSWKYPRNAQRTAEMAYVQLHEARIKDAVSTFMLDTTMRALSSTDAHTSGVVVRPGTTLGDGRVKGMRAYVPIANRPRMQSADERNKAFAQKQADKGKLLPKQRFQQQHQQQQQ